MYWKRSHPNCNGNRRDKVALRTTCIKNDKFKIIKIRTGCQCVGYFYYSKNLNCAACGPRVGHSCLKLLHNTLVWSGILKIDSHQVQNRSFLKNVENVLHSALSLPIYEWMICVKSWSASITIVVFDNFHKLKLFFFVNFFSPYCFHYVVVLLPHNYLRGLCAFLWFRHRQKCP